MNQGNIDLIKAECDRQGMHHVALCAYVLATVEHETAGTYEPVREAFYLGGGTDAGGAAEIYRRRLSYYPFYGRGFVQLTWRENYRRMGEKLGLPLEDEPDMAMEPHASAKILVTGMRLGMFTGRKLREFVNEAGVKDYVGARVVVNGHDRAEHIADLAKAWEARLLGEGGGG